MSSRKPYGYAADNMFYPTSKREREDLAQNYGALQYKIDDQRRSSPSKRTSSRSSYLKKNPNSQELSSSSSYTSETSSIPPSLLPISKVEPQVYLLDEQHNLVQSDIGTRRSTWYLPLRLRNHSNQSVSNNLFPAIGYPSSTTTSPETEGLCNAGHRSNGAGRSEEWKQ
ncbi:hypothetical protein BT69DRAFT_1302932 [Atractiella rhizophila]|nr:hypothetical protein BT69DRAFT_1302932 [Atractiella rhizophila]